VREDVQAAPFKATGCRIESGMTTLCRSDRVYVFNRGAHPMITASFQKFRRRSDRVDSAKTR
jgi:hypothetical protein